jgi:hypothetical protein
MVKISIMFGLELFNSQPEGGHFLGLSTLLGPTTGGTYSWALNPIWPNLGLDKFLAFKLNYCSIKLVDTYIANLPTLFSLTTG